MTQPTSAPPNRATGNLALIWQIVRNYPVQIAGAALALLTSSATTIAISIGFKNAIDSGFGGVTAHQAGAPDRLLKTMLAPAGLNSANGLSFWFEAMLVIVVILALSTAVRFYFVSWLGERVVADLRLAVQRNLLRLSPAYFETNRPSEIASRLTSDTALIEQLVGTTASLALRNALTGVLALAYLVYLAPKLTLFLVIGIPLVVAPIVVIGRQLRKLSRSSQDRVADIGSIITEELGAMKIVQAFGQEAREAERFGAAVETSFQTARRRIIWRALMTALIIMLLFGALVRILWTGAVDVQNHSMSGGAIAAFVLTGGLLAGAFGSLSEVYGDIVRGSAAASRLGELLFEPPTIAAPAHPTPLPTPAQGAIAFEAVNFSYPTRPDTQALHDFSLSVHPGETLAIVGPSGAGKTTLFQLLQRFYDPQSGTVRIDGVALPDADPAALRRTMAMVPQESVIFAASARDNLRYGRWDADDAALWAAAEAANAANFLRDLPDGLETYLGEGGARLSGGQRQRLAIARAVLRDAPILLLDEATSALDAESERLVQEALERLMANRTTLVIAHRLATVRAADRIVVMDEGRIVELGTHDSLVSQNGLYARLARLQFDGLSLQASMAAQPAA